MSLFALLSAVHAGELEQVHVFIGEGHARVLLLTDTPVLGATATDCIFWPRPPRSKPWHVPDCRAYRPSDL